MLLVWFYFCFWSELSLRGRTSRSWGYYPSGGLGLVLLIVIVLALMGRLGGGISKKEGQ